MHDGVKCLYEHCRYQANWRGGASDPGQCQSIKLSWEGLNYFCLGGPALIEENSPTLASAGLQYHYQFQTKSLPGLSTLNSGWAGISPPRGPKWGGQGSDWGDLHVNHNKVRIFWMGGQALMWGGDYPFMGGSPPSPHIGKPCSLLRYSHTPDLPRFLKYDLKESAT